MTKKIELGSARSEFAATLGGKIFRARKALGLTQTQLARELGLADGTSVGYWESGQSCPSIQLLAVLADALGLELDDLLRH